MAKHRTPGESLLRKLARDPDGLKRRETPDGGEVYSGKLAKAALRTMGARAMTLDETIIVDEDFDLSRPEDQALYAHERHHQVESGGHGAEGARDHEEVAARAIEAMVLHRAKSGHDFQSIMRDVSDADHQDGNSPDGQGTEGPVPVAVSGGEELDALQKALSAMRAKGLSDDLIVEELAREVINRLMDGGELDSFRSSSGGIM